MTVNFFNYLYFVMQNLEFSRQAINPAGKATSKRRRNNVRACRRIDVEKWLKTQMESTLRYRRRFDVGISTSEYRRRNIDVVSTLRFRPEEVGQLSREFLDQSNYAIFYASWLKFLTSKFTQGGKNV